MGFVVLVLFCSLCIVAHCRLGYMSYVFKLGIVFLWFLVYDTSSVVWVTQYKEVLMGKSRQGVELALGYAIEYPITSDPDRVTALLEGFCPEHPNCKVTVSFVGGVPEFLQWYNQQGVESSVWVKADSERGCLGYTCERGVTFDAWQLSQECGFDWVSS